MVEDSFYAGEREVMRNIDLENEKNFENRKASGEQLRAKQSKFYCATFIPMVKHKEKILKAIEGSRVLEIGCASGSDAVDYCKHAKSYIGVDISNVAIERSKASLQRVWFYCWNVERCVS